MQLDTLPVGQYFWLHMQRFRKRVKNVASETVQSLLLNIYNKDVWPKPGIERRLFIFYFGASGMTAENEVGKNLLLDQLAKT